MPNPTNYAPAYSFSGYQANNPSTPLPAPQLDNELAAVAAAVGTMVAAIMDVRRSDGALKNNIVTFDSLHKSLQLLVDPTNGELVVAAVASAEAAAIAAGESEATATAQAVAAAASAAAAAVSASGVNLALYLSKAGNLAGLGSVSTARSNLGLGSVATLDVGTAASQVVQLDGSAKLPAIDGSQLTNVDTLPVGAIFWVAATSAPMGCLKVNGALLSRATYSRLWAHANGSGNIVTEALWLGGNSGAYSTGDLATTFRLPDLRGEFIRGFDDGRGVDSGRTIGSRQADSLKDHTHSETAPALAVGLQGGGTYPTALISSTGTTTGSPSTGAAAETRPRNVSLLACVKY